MRHLINDMWQFTKFAPNTEFSVINRYFHEGEVSLTDEEKEKLLLPVSPVDIPHDWMVSDTNNLYQSSTGVYFRNLSLDGTKQNFLFFEGVYQNTTVYLNGKEILFWPYGYSSFEVDLTPYQNDGDNELCVYVNYLEPNTRWYSGAGIFRDVYLDVKEDTRIITNGVYFNAAKLDETRFKVSIDTEICTTNPLVKNAVITHMISDLKGNILHTSKSTEAIYREPTKSTHTFIVESPHLWNLDDPFLYQLTSVLSVDGVTVDVVNQRIGFRTIAFDPNNGFFLNGNHIKIHGACQHHDLGALGAAFNRSALKRQFEKLKSIGINSVRTSHNMPAKYLCDLADEMGMLIDSESFDMWEMAMTENDYHKFFHEWCEKDVESWVRRDRNHPSIIMWSIGNEIPDTNNPEGLVITKRLRDCVRKHDYYHNAYTTIGSNYVAWDNAQKCSDELEVSGYNYLESIYDEHHEKFPKWCIYGSETASTVQSRGIYHFPKSNRLLTYEDGQCSSLDNCSTNWGAKSVCKFITDDRDRDFCAGQYIWTGWDYIGEPTPYFYKNSYFGHIDTAGFYKDTAYIIKAGWVDYKTDPFIHIAPYWDFNPGQIIDINVTTNAPKLALFFNGELVGEKNIDVKKDLTFYATFSLPYSDGELKAVAYDENGNEIATDIKKSFSSPTKIVLTKEKESILADGEDLEFIQISVVDKDGNPVENARNRITVTVDGPGRIIGMDNGDSTDYDQYKTNSRKLFSGKLLAMVAPTKEAGKITVTATSIGLEDASISFDSVAAASREGVACDYRVPVAKDEYEIPIRKLTLTTEGSRELNESNTEIVVTATIEPKDATYSDITFKAMTSDGIESNSVEIIQDNNIAKIIAKGDGEFRLVAIAGNGKNHAEIMSDIECSVTGLGSATIDPYTEEGVHACQYAKSDVEALLSFRGGVNLTTNHTVISFENIDFGEYGSDELGFSIFSFRDEEPLEIWDGEPDKSDLLYKGTYKMKSIYNTYQENIFKLSKRIKGVRGITFRFSSGFVFGGFRMVPKDKAYGELSITEYNGITGDTYTETEEGIFAIGNNVDILFNNMFFSEGVSSITIKGRSNIPSNPVHIRFFGDDYESKQIVEFEGSDDIIERTFPLEQIGNVNRINFMFMPGSNFDFVGFKFNK